MLTRLFIHNVVLIEKLDLDFSKGLTIFSGETGAGKSVLLSSLSLVLGGKADVSMIRNGADKLCVEAVFEVKPENKAFWELVRQNDLEIENGEVVIKRSLSLDGKSKIFISDQSVTLKLLRQIGETLAEINGQFESVGLLKESTHIDVLDVYGGYAQELIETAENFKFFKKTEERLREETYTAQKNLQDKDTLQHYLQELENAGLHEGEEEELMQKRSSMMNAEKLSEYLSEADRFVRGEEISGAVRRTLSALGRANSLTNGKYENIENLFNTALANFDEAGALIEKSLADLSFNENDINNVEERLFALKALSRKHGVSISELPGVLEKIKAQLKSIQDNAELVEKLQKELMVAREKYVQSAQKLHELRLKTAYELEKNVENELKFLKMEKAEFRVCIGESSMSEKGQDLVAFEAKTNEGQPFGALSRIASGGELSRFMLALKVCLADQSGVETLIFDEIDSGVGGAVAEAVGNRLYKLSQNVQVMAVTHSPQISAFSQTHFKVEKRAQDGATVTNVRKLSDLEKTEEIARMLSGETISNEARAAAEKLIHF